MVTGNGGRYKQYDPQYRCCQETHRPQPTPDPVDIYTLHLYVCSTLLMVRNRDFNESLSWWYSRYGVC